MKIIRLSHISNEAIGTENADLLKQKATSIIEGILKTKLNIVELDYTKSFADYGCSPDTWSEIIQAINSALSIQLNPEMNYNTPEDLIGAVAAQMAEPIIAKESFNSRIFASYVKEAESLLDVLESMTDSSQEGFGTMLKRALISTGDLFCRMGNSFKASITRMGYDTKRSEIKMFWDGNRGKVAQVEGSTFDKFQELTVDIPTGMNNSYLVTINELTDIYNELDLYSFASTSSKYFNDSLLEINRQTGDVPKIDNFIQVIRNRDIILKKLVTSLGKLFSNDKDHDTAIFKEVYENMQAFKNTREKLLGLQIRIDESNRLNDLVDSMEKTLTDIQACVETDDQISKEFVQNLLEITKYMSEACSLYGETVSYQLALEHNHVLNLQACWMALK